ncbi:MAG: hypothetical protein V5A44_07615 [Haloarculaceae archaeon]
MGPSPDDRAVSELVGFVLVFALVVSVVGLVSVAGFGTLEDVRDAEQSRNAERAMEVLSDNMADIHQQGAPSRATEISLEGASVSLGEETQVIIRNNGSPTFLEDRVFTTRPIVYDDGDTELVYVMGAVFRVDAQGGTVIVPYDPVIGEDRTLLPVVTTVSATDGGQYVQSSTVLVRGEAITRRVPVADTDSKRTYQDVTFNVSSPRQTLWNRTLSENAGMSCTTNGPDWVNCTVDEDPRRLFVTETRITIEIAK